MTLEGGASLAGLPKCDLDILGTYASLWILQAGVSLQLDPQWHFKIASGPENPAFLLPAQPNEWSVEADLFSGGCTHDHDVDGLGGHRIVQCMERIMVYLLGIRLLGFKCCLYLLVAV